MCNTIIPIVAETAEINVTLLSKEIVFNDAELCV